MTARARLSRIQEEIGELYHAVDGLEGNRPNIESLKAALIDVMSSLDMAVNRAGRV